MNTPNLVEFLRGRGWTKAAVIEHELDLSNKEVRDMASMSVGQVISGQKGYRLNEEATDEEVMHSVNWLRSQAEEMRRRASEQYDFRQVRKMQKHQLEMAI